MRIKPTVPIKSVSKTAAAKNLSRRATVFIGSIQVRTGVRTCPLKLPLLLEKTRQEIRGGVDCRASLPMHFFRRRSYLTRGCHGRFAERQSEHEASAMTWLGLHPHIAAVIENSLPRERQPQTQSI